MRFIHIVGPTKGCWEDDCPQTSAKERNRKINPEPNFKGEVLAGDEALRLLILSGVQSGKFASKAFRAC